MKYYLIAGEASGDLHGSNLVKEIFKTDPHAKIRCWGGDKMQAAGATLVKHYRDLAFMGFAEVIANLPTILRNLRSCKSDISQFSPDVVVLIDYPGFNLRIAEWAKKQGLRVAYYISPQVWAWKENRVKKMKTCIDQLLVILPFEKDYYRNKWQWDVEYVGHPLVKVIEAHQPVVTSFSDKKIIAVLPGSRRQEIKVKLPIMLEAASVFADYQFVVAMAPSIEEEFYQHLMANHANVSAVGGLTYDLLMQASAAIVTSGTATLETALFGVPEVVCYKGNPISYAIAKKLISIKYISLVNLIMDRPVVKELIQQKLTPQRIGDELHLLLEDTERSRQLQNDYAELKKMLQAGGDASAKAASFVCRLASGSASSMPN
jgi:lipid-A-disaccharide synthase